MALQCGIVGLPNVGKSTIFNALTAAGIAAENYPFCTIEPNTGVVPVPDPRITAIDNIVHAQRVLPVTLEFVDIAGLVAGASKGEGLGNQFLGHIRSTDAIVHVVRCFEDTDVVHVEGTVDPLRDIETIETELALADLESLEKRLDRARKTAKTAAKGTREELAFFEELYAHLSEGKMARTFEVTEEMSEIFHDCHLITAKPVLYVTNVDETALAEGNAFTKQVEDFAASEKNGVVRLCGKVESELAELEDDEKREFLEDLGVSEPGLDRLAREGYNLLGLINYFTAGEKEVRAWTIRKGTLAPQAAGVIHTDFERGFIRVETIGYDDFIASQGEAGAKAKGLMRVEGKEYEVKDGDIMHFRFNV